MDALALLCNLYGDGPATLKRLKSAGLSSVESLDEIEAAGLADTLETTKAAARRFLKEARLLGERMAESGFEEETSPPIAHQGAGPVPIIELEQATDEPEPVTFEDDSEVDEEDADQALVEEVLTTWHERDILVEGDRDEGGIDQDARVPDDLGTPLELRLIDGLSADWCESFGRVGIRSLEGLAGMDTLLVAGQLGEDLTRLDRFRFLARRELEAQGVEYAAQQSVDDAPGILVPQPHSSVRAAPPASSRPAASGALATEPWPAAPAAAVKFSLAGIPFSGNQGPLVRELDRSGERPDEDQPADAGSAGPFG